MTKVMLVEDDKNLSAIYKDRLLAEGYDIVSAHDGEEALAMAVKEKPNLIIADVMMPKISGFDMLDILRSTPETKNTKVIIMTALSQVEDQQRATQLGADKYLVKSQVTLDDVARVVREVLGSGGAEQTAPAPTETELAPNAEQSGGTPEPVPSNPVETPMIDTAPMMSQPEVSSQPTQPTEVLSVELPAESTAQEKQEIEAQIGQMAGTLPTETQATVTSIPVTEPTPATNETPAPLQPATDSQPDIMALYEKEMAKEAETQAPPEAPAPPQNPESVPTDPHSSISL